MHFNVDVYMGPFVLLENSVDNEKPFYPSYFYEIVISARVDSDTPYRRSSSKHVDSGLNEVPEVTSQYAREIGSRIYVVSSGHSTHEAAVTGFTGPLGV